MRLFACVCAAGLATAMTVPASASTFDKDMERARAMTPVGETFESELAREYRDFFLFEADKMYDWPDADHFAEKSLAANSGQRVNPEIVDHWNIEGIEYVRELESARAKLTGALGNGAPELAPKEAAIAQARFDCWVEQQEEGWQWDHINACKSQFELAMANLQAAMTPPPAPEPVAAEPTLEFIPVTDELVIYFDFDKADVTPEARVAIDRFVETIEDKSQVEMVLTGHADRAGPADYNQDLSERRATAVKTVLVQQGLNIRRLEDLDLEAKGESEPALATPDGVREKLNRRVVIQGYGLRPVETQTSQLVD